MIWNCEAPEVTRTRFWPEISTTVSVEGSERTMVASFFTGSVMAPPEVTLALMRQRMPRSRFVVVSETVSPSASMRTFERMGIDARAPTTPRTWARPAAKWSRLILNFISAANGTIAGRGAIAFFEPAAGLTRPLHPGIPPGSFIHPAPPSP